MESVLNREKLIAKSKVREVFTPFSPVKRSDLLSGREQEIASLLSSISTPGQHALIYGNRGVGKSSVANIICELVKETLGLSIYIKKCSSVDNFTSIVSEVLASCGYDVNCAETISEYNESKGAKVSLSVFGGNLSSTRKKSDKVNFAQEFLSPSWVAKELRNSNSLLVIDEADVIASEESKLKLAEFIKHLSDYESSLKVLVVGISETGRDLVSNHRSVERCLNEIFLPPIRVMELRNIVEKGEYALGLKFESDVVDDIVDISGGYPHFVHLIALKCAEEVVVKDRKSVNTSVLTKAIKVAVESSEGGLRRAYEEAIRKNTDNSRKILLGAALCHSKGFLVSELLEMVNEVIDKDIGKSTISNCLSRWVSEQYINILTKVERGHYRFSDPRLMSYIKMVNGFTYDKRSIVADILKSEYSKRYVSDRL